MFGSGLSGGTWNQKVNQRKAALKQLQPRAMAGDDDIDELTTAMSNVALKAEKAVTSGH